MKVIAAAAAAASLVLTAPAQAGRHEVPQFWRNVAQCETHGLWDWGKYAGTPRARRGEGGTYEGGVGFYRTTWAAWARELGVRFAHAYQAPAWVQAKVAAYGLRVHHGYWGCIG